ncbi:MAG: hypothetical protein AAGM22_24215, partial [Acidobacteriota bacterium]
MTPLATRPPNPPPPPGVRRRNRLLTALVIATFGSLSAPAAEGAPPVVITVDAPIFVPFADALTEELGRLDVPVTSSDGAVAENDTFPVAIGAPSKDSTAAGLRIDPAGLSPHGPDTLSAPAFESTVRADLARL